MKYGKVGLKTNQGANEKKEGEKVDMRETQSSQQNGVAKPYFDAYATTYEEALSQGLAVSGETSEFFARSRIHWLADRIRQWHEPSVELAMDFGCGSGTSVPILLDAVGAELAVGIDVSRRLLEAARVNCRSERARYCHASEYLAAGDVDLAYCNGVFHHIPQHERDAAVAFVNSALRPGGLFALWENNPWNPGTRYVMSRIPFDRDAVPLSYLEARSLLRRAGFLILGTWFHFYFPAVLKVLRPMERLLTLLPLGAQYCVIARKPPVQSCREPT